MTMLAERLDSTVLTNDLHQRPVIHQEPAQLIYLLGGLAIAIHHDNGEWEAIEGKTGMFGEGDSELEALEDLLRSLYELRGDLASEYPILSDRLRAQLELLAQSLPTSQPPQR